MAAGQARQGAAGGSSGRAGTARYSRDVDGDELPVRDDPAEDSVADEAHVTNAIGKTGEPKPSNARRGRGRPRLGDRAHNASARGLILKAAAAEFAERGYDAASLRAIARRAEVDSALVHHYFDDKADLFAETVAAPLRPDRAVAAILSGPPDEFGAKIVRYVLEQAELPGSKARIAALLRTAIGTSAASRMLKQFLIREVFRRLTATIDTEDAELRAALAASQIIGMMTARFLLELEPLASAPVDEVVERIGPVIQWHLRGYHP